MKEIRKVKLWKTFFGYSAYQCIIRNLSVNSYLRMNPFFAESKPYMNETMEIPLTAKGVITCPSAWPATRFGRGRNAAAINPLVAAAVILRYRETKYGSDSYRRCRRFLVLPFDRQLSRVKSGLWCFVQPLRLSIAETTMAQDASPVMLTTVLPISKMRSTPATRAMPSTGSPTD